MTKHPIKAGNALGRLWLSVLFVGLACLGIVLWVAWDQLSIPTVYDEEAWAELDRAFTYSRPAEVVRVFGFRRGVMTPGVFTLDGTPSGLYITVVLEPLIETSRTNGIVEKPDLTGSWTAITTSTTRIGGNDVPLQEYSLDGESPLAWVVRFPGNDGMIRISIAIDPAKRDSSVVYEFLASIR